MHHGACRVLEREGSRLGINESTWSRPRPLSIVQLYLVGKFLALLSLDGTRGQGGLGNRGYDPSMFHSSRIEVVASFSCDHQQQQPSVVSEKAGNKKRDPPNSLAFQHAFYLATLGGAEALGLANRIGTIAIGMEFDALVLSAATQGPVQIFDTDTMADTLPKSFASWAMTITSNVFLCKDEKSKSLPTWKCELVPWGDVKKCRSWGSQKRSKI